MAAVAEADLAAAVQRSAAPKLIAALVVAALLGAAGWMLLNPQPAEVAVAPAEAPKPPEPVVPEAPAKVTLEVASQPPGAKVTRLDTNEVLGVTPLQFEAPRAETPVGLRLELAGRQTVEKQVTLARSVALSVDLPAEAKPEVPKPVEKKGKGGKKVTRDGVVDPFGNN
jgi:hypothetical protein